jgi:hypothetical protein
MTTLAVMVVVALLFVVFGVLRSPTAADCLGGSCASCTGVCHKRSLTEEEPHAS